MDPTPPPVLLLPSPEGVSDPATAAFAGLAGWAEHRGFDLAAEPWDLTRSRVLCVGTVGDDADARGAMAALTRGAGLAIRVTLRGAARHRFLEDLHKVGAPVPYEPPTASPSDGLSATQGQLLAALADGATVTAAADALHVSRRTANRLLADARDRLGVDTNAGAVQRWSAGPAGSGTG